MLNFSSFLLMLLFFLRHKLCPLSFCCSLARSLFFPLDTASLKCISFFIIDGLSFFFISTTCTPYTQLPSSIIPFSPAYRQSPKLSTVTVYAYVPSNGNSEEEIKEPLLPKKDEIPAYPLHTAVLLNPLYRFLFFICVDFSQKCGYNIL